MVPLIHMNNFTPRFLLFLFKFIVFIMVGAPVFPDDIIITTTNSQVSFNVKHLGNSTVYGSFNNFEGTLYLKNNEIVKAQGKIHIDSIETNNSVRNKYLKSKNFFNVKRFPFIYFYSDSFFVSGNSLICNGELNINNVSQNINLNLNVDPSKQYLSTTYTLNRFDYKLMRHKRMIAPSININIKLFLSN